MVRFTRPRIFGAVVVGAVFFLAATPSHAQCDFNISVYAEAGYSVADGNLYVWASAADYSSCGGWECYHEYYSAVWIANSIGETIAHVVGSDQVWAPAAAGQLYWFGAEVGVWCSCFMNWVAGATTTGVIEIPWEPPPPPPAAAAATIDDAVNAERLHSV